MTRIRKILFHLQPSVLKLHLQASKAGLNEDYRLEDAIDKTIWQKWDDAFDHARRRSLSHGTPGLTSNGDDE